jgi:cation:H+ antiporter
MQFFLLILGLVIIIKSADVLIDSASKIARGYGISSFIIAITVVAFGTSAPELAVGIVSGLSHTNQLTLGNIIGSSLSNIALIVGLSAIIYPLQVKDTVVKRELPILIVIQTTLGAMLFWDGLLSRIEGFILLCVFILFMVYICRDARNSMKFRLMLKDTFIPMAMAMDCFRNQIVIRKILILFDYGAAHYCPC